MDSVRIYVFNLITENCSTIWTLAKANNDFKCLKDTSSIRFFDRGLLKIDQILSFDRLKKVLFF